MKILYRKLDLNETLKPFNSLLVQYFKFIVKSHKMIDSEPDIKSISAFFYFKEPESLGNVVIIHTLSFISTRFRINIYTNQTDFLRKQLPYSHIISLDNIELSSFPVIGMLNYCRKIARILNTDGSDAVFIGHNCSPIALWLKKPCFQYVYQVHEMIGLDRLSGIERLMQKITEYFIIRGIRASKANFVVSEPIMQYLRLHKSYNIYLTPHSIDKDKFSNPALTDLHGSIIRKKEQGYFVVCYTGCISEKRGLQMMLESLSYTFRKDRNILFVVAGSDSLQTETIMDYFTMINFQDNVICLGKIDYDHVPGVIGLSDVCLSFLENNRVYQMSPPQKVLEYMASGKPVIANRIETHSMLIKDGYNGFLTENNPIEISEKILYLKADPLLSRQMSSNALKTAEKADASKAYLDMAMVIKDGLYNSEARPGTGRK